LGTAEGDGSSPETTRLSAPGLDSGYGWHGDVTIRVPVMLGIYFVSVNYVFVCIKLMCVCVKL
jgi:hypothetical protein